MARNQFSYVRMINFQFVNHQQLLINYFPAQQTNPMIHHRIFGFTIPTAMALVQVRFPGQLLWPWLPLLLCFFLLTLLVFAPKLVALVPQLPSLFRRRHYRRVRRPPTLLPLQAEIVGPATY
ncbi:unnamed protein product [Prunus brigantina]